MSCLKINGKKNVNKILLTKFLNGMQKKLRIFLLVLIIIGIILLFTEKIWVPKLVDRILSSEIPPEQNSKISTSTPVSISTKDIKEENLILM